MPFDLEYFNKITKGGLPNKTLNICLAGTGVGKSLFMCHMASCLMQNKNVLYITLEMSEERIAERIDANTMNVPMKELPDISKKEFDKKIDRTQKQNKRVNLIVKEYPTASAHVGHFRHLLQELNIKKDFQPDIIFVDYLNICASQRIRPRQVQTLHTC